MGNNSDRLVPDSNNNAIVLPKDYILICVDVNEGQNASGMSATFPKSIVHSTHKTADECKKKIHATQNKNIVLIIFDAVPNEFINDVHGLDKVKFLFILCEPGLNNMTVNKELQKIILCRSREELLDRLQMNLNNEHKKAALPKLPEFHTKIFQKQSLSLAHTQEYIVRGSRDLFPLLSQAFKGIQQIGVIGWSSQGPAQAQNLRDSLIGTHITVKVGLRENSPSIAAAERAGFTKDNRTLGEMYQVISESDFVLLLISDAAQAEMYKSIFAALRPKSTLGLSHGFILAYLNKIGAYFPKNINVVAVCPKGMGLSVRRLYQQGVEVNGAGINCSFAVEQDVTGMAATYALGWAVALGSPVTFQTTLRSEYLSDLVGERGILLGAVHGITESVYRWFMRHGINAEDAFIFSVESITGPISRMLSEKGILSVFQSLNDKDKETFKQAFSAAYMPAFDILLEIYDEVASGNEISSVIMAHKRHKRFPMGKIDRTDMWRIGEKVRAKRGTSSPPIHPVTAGLYLATMMAQVDLLKEKGHPYSEIANESIIEAVDSLNPYMHHKGVSFMVDNCSTTARLGARKWAPRFDYVFTQQALVAIDDGIEPNSSIFNAFLNNDIHEVLAVCAQLRPPINIAVIDI